MEVNLLGPCFACPPVSTAVEPAIDRSRLEDLAEPRDAAETAEAQVPFSVHPT